MQVLALTHIQGIDAVARSRQRLHKRFKRFTPAPDQSELSTPSGKRKSERGTNAAARSRDENAFQDLRSGCGRSKSGSQRLQRIDLQPPTITDVLQTFH